jgi:trimeric autotransporter adhesin
MQWMVDSGFDSQGMDWMITVQRLSWIGKIAAALFVTLIVASCGQFFPSANTIVSIVLSPTRAQIKPTATQQYSATGTFGNNTTGDVTGQVTWVSSAPNVATINISGLATAVALGTTNITARSGSVVSPASVLTVSNTTITSITVSPQSQTLTSGQQQQYTATDNNGNNITSSVSWTSSDTTVATITSSGVATAVATGTATITASLNGVAGTATLTVQ